MENHFSEEGSGGGLIMGMATDACWVGHFCVILGIFVSNYFHVEPGIFVSNRAFLCRTSVIMRHHYCVR